MADTWVGHVGATRCATRGLVAAAVAVSLVVAAPWADLGAHAAPGDTTLVSVSSAGVPAVRDSTTGDVSSDGRFVAFTSGGNNLDPADTSIDQDVYVRDLQTGVTELISRNVSPVGNDGTSWDPTLSADGRFVAFTSSSNRLVVGDANGSVFDVFRYDRLTDSMTLVTTALGGANDSSSGANISPDGGFITYVSPATNLVAGDTNGFYDTFVYDASTGLTERVTAAGGAQGDYHSHLSDISEDGTFVAFASAASNLVPGDTNGQQDIFVQNRDSGVITRITRGADGSEAVGGSSFDPFISDDGRYVAFYSEASNLTTEVTDASRRVYWHDRDTGLTRIVSRGPYGLAGGGEYLSDMSGDGRYVLFFGFGRGLTGVQDYTGEDVFVRDMRQATTDLVSVDSDGEPIDAGGSYGHISDDGSVVAFHSYSATLAPPQATADARVFVRERVAPADPPAPVSITQAPAPTSGDTTPTFAFSSSEFGAAFDCSLVAVGDPADYAPCTSPTTYSAQPDGDYSFTVRASDEAGNPGQTDSRDFTIDTAAAAVTLDSTPGALGNDATPTFAFTATGADTVECQLDPGAGFAPCTSPVTFGPLADGSYTFTVRATDTGGSDNESFAFAVDTSAPPVVIDSGPGAQTTDDTPTFAFSAEPGATFECRISLGVHPYTSCTSPVTYGPLPAGTYTFAVRATDAAGNLGAVATYTFTIGTVVVTVPVPSVPDLAAASDTGLSSTDNVTSDETPTFTGTAANGTTVTIVVDGVVRGSAAVTAGTYAVTTSTLPQGVRQVTAIATDGDGNASDTSAALQVETVAATACHTATNTINGTAANNTINGARLADRIFGLGGNDTIEGRTNNDCLVGGTGNDQLRGGVGNDELVGDDGADTLALGAGVDVATGGAGNDRITARDGTADRVDCGAGTADIATIDNLDTVVNCETVRLG